MRKVTDNSKGVTLIALVVTILLLLILASVATYSGIGVINSSKLTAFTTEMKIMQIQVNNLYDQWKNGDINKDELGKDLTYNTSVQEQANTVLINELRLANTLNDLTGYRYFDQETIQGLGIEGVEQEFFINIEKREIVSYKGLQYEGDMYYTLNQLPNGLYNVDYNPNQADEPTFDLSYEKIGDDKWRITISNIQYDGYIDKWYVKYQKEGNDYWSTTEDMSFVVREIGTYKIKVFNGNIETSDENIKSVKLLNEYIKDGMVLYLDGINNTGEGDDKHSTTTTTWKDLSGNNNDAILQNFVDNDEISGWRDNSLKLDGIDDYAIIADSETMKPVSQTIEIVFNRTGKAKGNTDSSNRGIIFVRWYGYTVELNEIDSSNRFSVSYGRNRGYSTSNTMLQLNKAYYLGATHENNISKIYLNSVYESEQSVEPLEYGGIMNETWIGNYTSGALVEGNIYAIRMYNRALSENELKYNYEIDKVRFDLE